MLSNLNLVELNRDKDDMKNKPAIIFQVSGTFSDTDGIYGLIFGQSVPATLNIDSNQYVMALQKKKTYLPFAIELEDFIAQVRILKNFERIGDYTTKIAKIIFYIAEGEYKKI